MQYDSHADVQRQVAAWLAEWLPASLEGPSLELGAGTGIFTRYLAERTTQLEATDIAPEMVRIGKAAFPHITWAVADASAPLQGGFYQGIFSCSLVQWLSNPEQAFRAWRQKALPGARLLSGWFVHGTLRDFFAICPEATPFVWRNTATWLALLEQTGWQVLRHEERHFKRHDPQATAMLRAIHNIGANIPHRLGTVRLRQALRAYDKTHRGPAGVASTFSFLRIEAVAQPSP